MNEAEDAEDCEIATELAHLIAIGIDEDCNRLITEVRKSHPSNELFFIVTATGATYTVMIDKRVAREESSG